MINHSECKTSTIKLNLKLQWQGQVYVIIVMREYPNPAIAGSASNIATKKVIFQNWGLFINCMSKINNTQVDDANDIDIVM